MTCEPYVAMVAGQLGEGFDPPFPSFAEPFSMRQDRLSC
jgi:hypothetical protein